VIGETGDVLAVWACGGAANDGRAMGWFIHECLAAVRPGPVPVPAVDPGRFGRLPGPAIEAAERHDADFTVTAKGYANVAGVV
jgi:hypothetical protein